MLSTLKESISVSGQMICLSHPWHDPVPFRRVWCLFEMYTAIKLGANIIMVSVPVAFRTKILTHNTFRVPSAHKHFPPEDAEGFYSKLHEIAETTVLVPTIDARQAQATVESDRVRIFKEITDSIGMEAFNSQLQEYLERGLRGVATEALLQKGGVESLPAGGSKVTMGMLRGDLEQLKQLQQDTQQQVQAVATQQQVQAVATQQQVRT